MTIPASSPAAGKWLLDLGLSKGTLVTLIWRKGQSFVPNGSTVLEANDVLLVCTDQASSLQLHAMLDGRRSATGEGLTNGRGQAVALRRTQREDI